MARFSQSPSPPGSTRADGGYRRAVPVAPEQAVRDVGRDLAAALPDAPGPSRCARSTTRRWTSPRRTPSCAPRSSASSTSSPPAAPSTTWPATSPASSTRSATARRRCRPRCGCRAPRARAHRAGRRLGRRRAPHGPPLHRRRDAAATRAGCSRACGATASATLGRPARRGDRHRRRGRPLRGALPRGARRAGRRLPRPARPGPPLERDGAGADPAREPVGEGLGAHAAAAPRRAGARQARRRRRGCASCCATPGGSARTCTSTWSPSTRARRSPTSSSSCSPRTSSRDGPSAGLVLQAYLRDSPELADRDRRLGRAAPAAPHPLVVRLVKGAYWDHEVVEARQHGWSTPVFEVKAECDRNFEALTRRAARGAGAGAVARRRSPRTTCARSRHAIAANRAVGVADADLELQVLRGLGDDLQHALAARGLPRAHLLPGRRPRRRHGLPRPPAAGEHEQRVLPARAGERRAARGAAGRAVSPPSPAVLRQRAACSSCAARPSASGSPPALDAARRRGCRCACRCWIGDDRRDGDELVSTDPGDPERVVALAPIASAGRRRRRGRAPRGAAFPALVARPAAERAAVLAARGGVAARAPRRARRARGARVRQAVGRGRRATSARRSTSSSSTRAARSRSSSGKPLFQVPGRAQRDALRRRAASSRSSRRGTSRSRSRWAWSRPALATGNAVVLKPAEQSPGCGHVVVRALREAGVPPERARAPARRRARPAPRSSATRDVATIAFTGSRPGRPRDPARRRRRAARAAPPQARRRRDGRQELRRSSTATPTSTTRCPRSSPRAFRLRRARSARPRRACSSTRRSPTRCSSASPARSRSLQVGQARRVRHRRPAGHRARGAGARRALPRAGRATPGRVVAERADGVPGDGLVRRADGRRRPARRLARSCTRRSSGRCWRSSASATSTHACDRVDELPFALTGGLFSRNPHTVERVVAPHAGRQPLRQPRDHRRDGRPPAVRRQPPLRDRDEGRRPGLPAALRRAAGRDREHRPPRPRDLSRGRAQAHEWAARSARSAARLGPHSPRGEALERRAERARPASPARGIAPICRPTSALSNRITQAAQPAVAVLVQVEARELDAPVRRGEAGRVHAAR